MKGRIPVCIALLLMGMLISLHGRSQGNGLQFKSAKGDSTKTVFILHDDQYQFRTLDSVTNLVILVGHVQLQEDRTLIDCDSMIQNSHDNYIECYGHVHIFDGDSTNIYSDYMKYEALRKTVLFTRNVKMSDGKGILTTQELQYDLNTKIGVYEHGGKVINNGSVLTSEEATYFGDSKDVYFRKNVVLRDPQYDLRADSLLYNTQTQISHFITETFIQFKDSTQRTVKTREGFYDLKNKKAEFGKRSFITDGSQQITGDSILIDDSTGISKAMGNAIYKDTAQGAVTLADYMVSDKKKNLFIATQKPVMIIKQDKDQDSLYITGDSLVSGRLIDEEAEEAKRAHDDSVHQVYVDSLYKVQADSMHELQLRRDSLHRAESDSLASAGPDSTSHITVRDRSHELNRSAITPDTLAKAISQGAIAMDSSKRAARERVLTRARAREDSIRKVAATADSIRSLKLAGVAARQAEQARIAAAKAAAEAPPPTDSAMRYIKVYHKVRIWSDSLQAVADSLFYSGKDSIFRLFRDPIAWGNGGYQITGDTMFLYTKNKKADRLYVFENALAIKQVAPDFYNQLKGTTINGYFKDGQMDYLRAKGSAESIYYVQDDNKAYTGVNKAHADIIDIIFENKEIDRVVLRNDVEGTMTPFRKVNFDEMKLRGFKWQNDKRPKSKDEILGGRSNPTPADLQPVIDADTRTTGLSPF